MARSREFNRHRRRLAALAVVALTLRLGAGPSLARADEIRKWRDADGKLHYSVTGSESAAGVDAESPIIQGRQATSEEAFSVEASLRRKEIETKLVAAKRDLDEVRKEIGGAEARQFNAWVPRVTGSGAAAQASLDAQRDAFLAASQFEEQKAEDLRRLHRRERTKLREIVALWKEFTTLDGVVTERYGAAPDWWRKRLSCSQCPTLAEAERELSGPKTSATPAPGEATAGKSPEDEDWGEEDADEDWR